MSKHDSTIDLQRQCQELVSRWEHSPADALNIAPELRKLLAKFSSETSLLHAEEAENLGFCRLDHDRAHRCGFPEVVYGENKSSEQILTIFSRLYARHSNILVTRIDLDSASAICKDFPDAEYHQSAKVLRVWRNREVFGLGKIEILVAGTSDLPIAEEAQLSAETMGNEVGVIADIGVAGLHRLLAELHRVRAARILICIAGMEASLPSVVTGLVSRPVIAVPTSIGYGANLGGITALLACLSSCAAGLTTVNINNGFGAAYAASLMNRP